MLQRQFLNQLALKYEIKNPRDWGKLKTCDVITNGGRKLLKDHSGSLFKSLQHNFPEIEWKEEWMKFMPRNYWTLKPNQRNFLDNFAKKFGIKKPEDWGKITWKQVLHEKGGGLLNVYNNSLYRILTSVYSDIKWKREWFPSLTKYERTYWELPSNQKSFLDMIAVQYNIQKTSDWKRITISMIRNLGGQPLLSKYGHSVFQVLSNVYSQNVACKESKNTEKTTQQLHRTIDALFPIVANK